VLDTKLT